MFWQRGLVSGPRLPQLNQNILQQRIRLKLEGAKIRGRPISPSDSAPNSEVSDWFTAGLEAGLDPACVGTTVSLLAAV